MNSYPHAYPQATVDDATHRFQSLTDCQKLSLYLKDNLLKIKKINKKIINIKNLLVIPMSILILTLSTTPAKATTQSDSFKLYAHSRIVNDEQYQCFYKLINKRIDSGIQKHATVHTTVSGKCVMKPIRIWMAISRLTGASDTLKNDTDLCATHGVSSKRIVTTNGKPVSKS